MKYDYKTLRELSEHMVRQILISMFRRKSDKGIREIIAGNFTPEHCRNEKYYVEDDCIRIGYYEGWDEDEVYVVLYDNRIEYTFKNKFSPISREILMDFRK